MGTVADPTVDAIDEFGDPATRARFNTAVTAIKNIIDALQSVHLMN